MRLPLPLPACHPACLAAPAPPPPAPLATPQQAGSGISLPLTREDTRSEILTPPDLVNLGALGRPTIVTVAGLVAPSVPVVTMNA